MDMVPNFRLGSGLSFGESQMQIILFAYSSILMKHHGGGGGKKILDLLIKFSGILAAMYPRPIYMVPNLSISSGLSCGVSHMQII